MYYVRKYTPTCRFLKITRPLRVSFIIFKNLRLECILHYVPPRPRFDYCDCYILYIDTSLSCVLFYVQFCVDRCLFFCPFLLVDVLSVLRFTYSDYPYGVFNLFFLYKKSSNKEKRLCPTITIIESGSWGYVMNRPQVIPIQTDYR
jgi:hypothetical protein